MRCNPRVPLAVCLSVIGLIQLATSPGAMAADWPRIEPADLALAKPRIDPRADAEALLWDVRVTDASSLDTPYTVLAHHLRIKVFTDRGRDDQSKVDLTYTDAARIRDVEARTITPDGRILELRGSDVFDRTIVKVDGVKVKAKSFVLPAVVAGSIVEYRWSEYRDSFANYLELGLQRDLPVHVIRYHIKPLPVRDLGFQMRTQSFNMATPASFKKDDGGYSLLEVQNVPALRRERYMPPETFVKSWMLIYYADLATADLAPEKFWEKFGRSSYDDYKARLRANNDVAVAAKRATADAVALDAKIAALLGVIRERVTRDDRAASRRRADKDNTAADTLKRGNGSGEDIAVLFAAMATAAGLDARLAFTCDRDDAFCPVDYKQPYFLSHILVAVKDGNGWKFVDPNNRFAVDGHVRWQQEGLGALLLDPKTPAFVDIPPALSTYSTRKRAATLALSEDGVLEGDVTLEYTGHFAMANRERDADDSVADRQRRLTDDLSKDMPGIELTDFSFEHLEDPAQPYSLRFKIRVPGYAQKTGSRLFMQPAVIQRGAQALLTETPRRFSIHFPFPWSEQDTIALQLPADYEVESNETPQAVGLNNGSAAMYAPKLVVDPNARRATFTRTFFVAGDSAIFYPAEAYAQWKNFFTAVRAADDFTLSLRKRGSGANTR
jgi:hypothetical protein